MVTQTMGVGWSLFFLAVVPLFPGEERYLRNPVKLTEEGINAEAYFSFDGRFLIFQSTRADSGGCDQIYMLEIASGKVKKISEGGRTTCAFFFPDGKEILYSSTMHLGGMCPEPPPPPKTGRYAWPLLEYDIYIASADGSNVRKLIQNPGYDAESVVSRSGKIVFTSFREGDPGIYLTDKSGLVRKVINQFGYEGGPWFSPDERTIVFRAFYPKTEEEKKQYRELLEKGYISPPYMEIYVVHPDGSGLRQITHTKALNFAPSFHPDGEHIIFSSNMHNPGSGNFNLYLIRKDGTGLRRITHHPGVDLFPMFSPDGKKLVFISNRVGGGRKDLHIYLAEWVWKEPFLP